MAPMSVPHSVWGKMTPSFVAMPLMLRAAGDHQRLAADEVAVRTAEEIDRAGRFLREAAAAERDHLVHGRDAVALDAHLHRAARDLDRPGLALREGLGASG